MSKAHVTPENLKEFVQVLRQNIEKFEQIESSTRQKLDGYDWNDPVAEKFKVDFEETKKPIDQLIQVMNDFIPFLNNKVGIVENYLGGAATVGVAVAATVKADATKTADSTKQPKKTATVDERTMESCPTYREDMKSDMKSGKNLKVTSEERKTGSHSNESCGIDFSVKELADGSKVELNDDEIKKITQAMSEGGSFCQYEKVDGGKQTDYRYQDGNLYKTAKHDRVQKGVTASHIHCQKPQKPENKNA
ncbi:MAG: hypothetical protein LBI45_02880 [Bacteroidales bacterium]|jgi:hypothetical protein|nr:hypothetical protein [Bacteroidales bacterium]